MAKLLFIISFFLDLLYREECGKVSCHRSHSHMVMSHNEYRKVVHRLCSSCISSIQKITGTPSSSSCQLG